MNNDDNEEDQEIVEFVTRRKSLYNRQRQAYEEIEREEENYEHII